MGNKGPPREVATEYPYQSLYRPWSWIFSSFFNIFLFMALAGFLYFYYRRRKHSKSYVTYRTRVVRQRDEQAGKKVAVVTGGGGRLGRELVRRLTDDGGYDVHSLDLLLPEDQGVNSNVCTYIQGDITNVNDLIVAFKGVDVVFHCAGLVPTVLRSDDVFHTVNYGGTEAVVNACKECGVKRLVYTSSASITLRKDPKYVCEDCDESCPIPDDPLNSYVASKGAADKLVRESNGKEGLTTCVLRPNVLTETMYDSLEKNLYRLTGYDFELSTVSVSSAAQAHVLAEKKLLEGDKDSAVAGKAFNIGEEKLNIGELVTFIAKEKNVSPISLHISLVRFLARLNEAIFKLTGLVAISPFLNNISVNMKTHTYVCERAREQLGWVQGPSWREVVSDLMKKSKEEKEEKKEK